MVINSLISILKQEKSQTQVRRNALESVQKLSLRKKTQIIMIKSDLIKWIIQVLKEEHQTLPDYTYEYTTALLMNLSLRTLGKQKCSE